jgi:hypothetical protein
MIRWPTPCIIERFWMMDQQKLSTMVPKLMTEGLTRKEMMAATTKGAFFLHQTQQTKESP